MTKKTLAAITAAMTLAVPASAFAGDSMEVALDSRTGMETRSQTVSLNGLDLTRNHDARLAHARIERAARQTCGWMRGSIQQPTREYRACLNDALSSAKAELASGRQQG